MNLRLVTALGFGAVVAASGGAGFAADLAIKVPKEPAVSNWSGFYVGIGGSFDRSRFDQSLQGVSGVVSVVDAGVLVAQGQEGGPFFDFNRKQSTFAPEFQLGYQTPIASGGWLAGVKFSYKFANINSKQVANIPQNGVGSILSGPQAGTTGPITGFVLASPAEIDLRHQFLLLATVGRAFGNFTIYGGAGPALFGVKTNFLDTIPFATTSLNGTFPAGAPMSVFNANWVAGGAAQVGGTYVLARGWFLDLAYTYARSRNFTIANSVFVQNQTGTVTISGPAVLNTQERVTNQSVTITLNYGFP